MIYIGSKKKSLTFLSECFREYGIDTPHRVADLFAGTGAVARYFGNLHGTEYVLAVDNQYFSYVWLKAILTSNTQQHIMTPLFPHIGFISTEYASHGRKYFTPENAAAIDATACS